MKQELVFDSISYTKMEKLTAAEITSMKTKIIKQLKVYVPGYLVLTGIAIYILIRGPRVVPGTYGQINDDFRVRFWQVAPYFSLFLVLLSTIFLAIYYIQFVHPYLKDIKQKKKIAVFFRPKKTAMNKPDFDEGSAGPASLYN